MFLRIAIVCMVSWLVLDAESLACLNTYGTDMHGRSTMLHELPSDLAASLRRAKINRERWTERAAELATGLESGDYQHKSDYAVALIYLGRYDDAIRILEAVEQEQPGEYVVAANLGTAYELNGDVEQALEWIKKGFERNAESHDGSEWLHVMILEAKLQLAEDPNWLNTHTVLGIDFGDAPAPSRPDAVFVDSMGKSHELNKVADAIEYQLRERMQFVAPQDALVADLLFDLGNTVALTSVVEQAVHVYELAGEYGVQDPPLLQQRIAHFNQLAAANPRSGRREGAVTVGSIALVGAAFLGLALLAPVLAYVAYRKLSRSKTPKQA